MPGLAEQRHERQTRKHTKAHQHGHVLERNNRGLLVERVKHRERCRCAVHAVLPRSKYVHTGLKSDA